MKIKDLPQEIKELAILRYNEQGLEFNESSCLEDFTWYRTPEKLDFWAEINIENFSVYYALYGYPNDKPSQIEVISEEVLNTPEHYDNSKGTLYKVAKERKWNPYLFDIIKRLERAEKKGEFKTDLEKSINVIKLWLKESEAK